MPIEKGCTHCGSDQHNTTECPMMLAEREVFEASGVASCLSRDTEPGYEDLPAHVISDNGLPRCWPSEVQS